MIEKNFESIRYKKKLFLIVFLVTFWKVVLQQYNLSEKLFRLGNEKIDTNILRVFTNAWKTHKS